MIPSFQEKMVKAWQQAEGPDLVQRRNPSKKIPETLRPVVGGIDLTMGRIPLLPMVRGTNPTPCRIPLGSKSRVSTIIDLDRGKSQIYSHTPQGEADK